VAMKRIASLAVSLVLAGGVIGLAFGHGKPSAPPRGDAEKGRALYAQKCAVCHGAEGRGDGPAEFVLFPKPRDLTRGTFKIRSTPTLPTDQDLFRVITRGIPGTAMPGWAAFTEADRWDLVAYVKSLSPLFARRPAPKPVPIPPAPRVTPALLEVGKKFYAEAECLKCHGAEGKGDGEAADTLKDDWGAPIVPYDFTQAGRMKGGSAPRDVYRTLVAGIGGTPMPSYADALSSEELWGVAYYVLSLAGKPAAPPLPDTGTLTARRVARALPADPTAPVWRSARRQAVMLRTLWMRPRQVGPVRVAALHNGKEIGFLLEWDDPIADQAALGLTEFRDAAAVQFPLQAAAPHDPGHPEPSYAMGDGHRPVNIWHWKADWQLDLARYRDLEDRFPAVAVDDVPFVAGIASSDPRAILAPAERHDPLFLTGRGAGNPMALPRRSAVENLSAAGVGTITSQPPEAQVVRGAGRWADGTWRVVMTRPLRTGNPRDAQFEPGLVTAVAFAVWDGSQGDRDGQKAVSVWQRLRIEAGR
jgi:mono/diheme cytochrome c family protein